MDVHGDARNSASNQLLSRGVEVKDVHDVAGRGALSWQQQQLVLAASVASMLVVVVVKIAAVATTVVDVLMMCVI